LNGLCVGLAVAVQANGRTPRPPAIAFLVLGVLATAAVTLLGRECGQLDGRLQGPKWLEPEDGDLWQWSVCGCLLWSATTVASAWRQLDQHEEAFTGLASPLAVSNLPAGYFNNVPFGIVPCGTPHGNGGRYTGVPSRCAADAEP